ncbi:MAG: hypothetical protein HZB43_05830 [candidate division Zixibacteria bacterium]|nr:hypothetical protein [candidate division Zixibacteria bacterium]
MENYRRKVWSGVLLLMTSIVVASFPGSAKSLWAQTPKVYVDLGDTTSGWNVQDTITVFIQNMDEPIEYFQLLVTMSRPDLAYWDSIAIWSSAGTLTASWSVGLQYYSPAAIQITGYGTAIPAYTSGNLIKLLVHTVCPDAWADTLQDRTVSFTAGGVGSWFMTPTFSFISPVDWTSGSVTVRPTSRGDLNQDQVTDIFDITALQDYLFNNGPSCPPTLADVNCDDVADIFDLIYLIEYVFNNGQPPC